MDQVDFLLKVILVGGSKVGKTCLVKKYVSNDFNEDERPTIGVEFGSKQIFFDGKTVKLQLWDSSGQDKYRSMTAAFYRGAVGVIFVFDISSKSSFEEVKRRMEEVRYSVDPAAVLFLVGNKLDLESSREVFESEAMEFAQKHKMRYWETSAKTGEHVNSIFENVAKGIVYVSSKNDISSQNEYSKSIESKMIVQEEMLDSSPRIDNIFGDLENMFNSFGACILKSTCNNSFQNASLFGKLLLLIPRALSFCLSFIFYFFLMLVLILPSFFWLLLLRTRKIEVDSKDFSIRQEALERETAQRKSLRWISLVIRAIPMLFVLVMYPAIVLYGILPKFSGSYDTLSLFILIGVGSHLLIILLFQVLGTIRFAKSVEMKKRNAPEVPQFHWRKIGNWIAIITITVDFVQMCAFPLQELKNNEDVTKEEEESSDILNYVAKNIIPGIFLTLSEHLWDFTFYLTIFAVFLLLGLFTLQFMTEVQNFIKLQASKSETANEYFFFSFIGSVVYGHGEIKNVNSIIKNCVALLSDTLFMTICNKLLTTLACTYTPNGPFLIANSSDVCWHGTHVYQSFLAMASFAYYVPLCVMIAPMFIESESEKKDIRFVESYLMTMTVCKCALLVFATFFSQARLSMTIATIIFSTILFIITLLWGVLGHASLLKPASFPAVNILKCLTYELAACISVLTILYHQGEVISEEGQFIGIIVLMVVNAVVFVLWKIFYKPKNAGFAKLQSTEMGEL